MIQIDIKKLWEDIAIKTIKNFCLELKLQGVDVHNMLCNENEMFIEETKKRLDLAYEEMLNNPIVSKEIDRQNNLIRQKNFLSQKSYNPKKKKGKK